MSSSGNEKQIVNKINMNNNRIYPWVSNVKLGTSELKLPLLIKARLRFFLSIHMKNCFHIKTYSILSQKMGIYIFNRFPCQNLCWEFYLKCTNKNKYIWLFSFLKNKRYILCWQCKVLKKNPQKRVHLDSLEYLMSSVMFLLICIHYLSLSMMCTIHRYWPLLFMTNNMYPVSLVCS